MVYFMGVSFLAPKYMNNVISKYTALSQFWLFTLCTEEARHHQNAISCCFQLNYFSLHAVTYTYSVTVVSLLLLFYSCSFYSDITVAVTELISCNSSHHNSVYLTNKWEVVFAVLRFESADQSSQTFH